jgi:lysophospholipase L1-like esterase
MKLHRPVLVVVSLLTVLLLGSIALNCFLFERGRQYYFQLNETRLDPLGLHYYDTASDQRNLTNPELTTVVFFGDSRAASWPAPDLNQFEFINRAIRSQTSEQAVERFSDHVKPLEPQVVVIQIGINDVKTIPLFPERKEAIIANCEENIRQLVAWSADWGAMVIVTPIFPIGKVPLERRPFWSDDVGLAVDEVNAFIHTLKGENVLVFDAFSLLVGEGGRIRPEYSRDLLHLNTAGYERLNEELAPILKGLRQ